MGFDTALIRLEWFLKDEAASAILPTEILPFFVPRFRPGAFSSDLDLPSLYPWISLLLNRLIPYYEL